MFVSLVGKSAVAATFIFVSVLAISPPVTAQPIPSPRPTTSVAPGQSGTPAQNAVPSPSASPSATATPRPLGLTVTSSASVTLVNQNTAGDGQIAPEAPGFIAGSPLSPNTPYDLFSSAPQVPGVAGIGTIVSTATYRTRSLDVSLTPGLGYVRGSIINASYYGENLLPPLNPHLGSQALPYAISFPSHPGEDDGTALRLSLLAGSIGTADGNLKLRGGYFDLAQTQRFVFLQPALTNLNPSISYAPAETLSNGLAGSDLWQPYAVALPLHGIDVVTKRGIVTVELTYAALPSLPGESARMRMGSIVLDHGEGTQFAAQLMHVTTSGAFFGTTVPFGLDPRFSPTPQGILPTSSLSGQRETIGGLHAAFHMLPALGVDGVVDIGRSWYDASPVALSGSQRPGGYYHLGATKTRGRATATLDLYRMEPRYATAILPYGIPENQWSAAFAWPGQWLKSNYQLIDNSVLGVNRQGYRLRYYVDKGPLEVHFEYSDLRQIEPETTVTSLQSGFLDGYYLPQLPGAATFGRQKRYGFWAAWHPKFGDVTLDIIDDTLYRPFIASHLEDRVSYEVPQAMLTYAAHVSSKIVATIGVGRYAMKGTFAEPLDFSERLFFAGVEVQQTSKSALLVTFRRTSFDGLTTFPSSPRSPNFTGSGLILEQRFSM